MRLSKRSEGVDVSGFFSESRSRQRTSFEGLNWGTARFTDIDGFMDVKGQGAVFVEAKALGAVLAENKGQIFALRRVVTASGTSTGTTPGGT